MTEIVARECLQTLSAHAREADENAVWPTGSWDALAQAGVLGWSIGREEGGAGLPSTDLLAGYERLASACLTTGFILSQRDAAFRRIEASANESLRRKLLGPLARGEHFATVGLSQLTTSRQHLKPTLVAHSGGMPSSSTAPFRG